MQLHGYTLIPGAPGTKAPLVKFAHLQGDHAGAPQTFNDKDYATDVWLLLLSSKPAAGLVVVDVDDMSQIAWATDTFGITPLTVTTGRGVHLYYRAGGQRVVSRNGMVHVKVDVKAWGAYVVAPDSHHAATGKIYTASQPVTPELLDSLPLFDNDRYEQLCKEAAEGRRVERIAIRAQGHEALAKKGFVPTLSGGSVQYRNWSEFPGLAQLPTGTHAACPFHVGDGERTLYIYEGGREAHCFKEGVTYLNYEAPKFVPWRGAWHDETPADWELPTSRYPVDAATGFLTTFTPTARVTVIQAGRGSGKTHQLANHARACKGVVVAVSPTRSLTRSLSTRFNLPNYQDTHHGGRIDGSCAFCTPSLWRAEAGEKIELLVLDEIEQQVRTLAGDHLSDAEARRAWDSLISRIQLAQHVVMMDADAGPATMALLHAAGVAHETAWLKGPDDKPREWVCMEKRAQVTEDALLRLRAGQKVAVYYQSRAGAHALEKAWINEGFRVACISATSVDKYDLSSFEWLRDYDALIYTPLLGTGVSIEVPFNYVYAILAPSVGTIDDFRQAVARIRHPTHTEIKYWGPKQSPVAPEACDVNEVVRGWIKHRDTTPTTYRFRMSLYDDYTSATGSLYTVGMATTVASDLARGYGWLATATANAPELQHVEEIIPMTDRDTEDTLGLNAYLKAVKLEEAERVVSAAPLDDAGYQVLLKRGPNSLAEADSVRKHAIEAFYGDDFKREPITTVLQDDDGRRRSRLRILRDVLYTPVEALREADDKALKAGVSGLRFVSRQLRAAYYNDLLTTLGGLGMEVTPADCKLALEQVPRNAAVTVPNSNPTACVGGLMRQMGLKWARVSKHYDAATNKQYWTYKAVLPADIPWVLDSWRTKITPMT